MEKRILSVDEIKSIYGNWAGAYNFSLWLFYLSGFRIGAYRKMAVEGLNLKAGDTIIDLGCGTGLNFKLLKERIGPGGKIIGVDLSDDMLGQAKKRVDQSGWQNISLIQADIADYSFPEETDGILSTLALTMSPEYDQIIERAKNALKPDHLLSIFELKNPEQWPDWLVKGMITLIQPYGTRPEHIQRTPWLSMEKHFTHLKMKEYYFGAAYVATGWSAE